MAIAQKCGLSLSALPCKSNLHGPCSSSVLFFFNVNVTGFSVLLATIEAGLMDEPCDFEVCTEASTPGSQTQLFSRARENRRAKADLPAAPSVKEEAVETRKPKKTQPVVRRGAPSEGNPRRASPMNESLPQISSQAEQTRKELQDALPKIPPLSSFKSCSTRFMDFEEAERDFHTFITTGLGRSVEVIRDFRGQEDGGDPTGHRESIMLDDHDGAQGIYKNCERWKAELTPAKPGSSSSESDMEESQQDVETLGQVGLTRGGGYTQPEASQRSPVAKEEVGPVRTEAQTPSAPKIYPQTSCATSGRTLPQSESHDPTLDVKPSRRTNQASPPQTVRKESRKMREEIGKRSKRVSEKMRKEPKRERDEGEHDEEDECSAEAYWGACYRAWNDYYASMSPFQEQGYQSYYSAAHSWMAAYRMNTVYMEELMKH